MGLTHIDVADRAIKGVNTDDYDGMLLDFDGTIRRTDGIYDVAFERLFTVYRKANISNAYSLYVATHDVPIGMPWTYHSFSNVTFN